MGILDRLSNRGLKDPYWERFMSGPLADVLNEPSASYRTAPPGPVFPVKTDIPEPSRMASDVAEFAAFLGANAIGATRTDPSYLQLPAEMDQNISELAVALPTIIVVAVAASADPDIVLGIGGQQPRRQAALVVHGVASYIRELGFRGFVCPIDRVPTVHASGLRSLKQAFVGDAILTDLPIALGVLRGQ